MIYKIIHKILGRSERKNAIVQSKNEEADLISKEMLGNIKTVTEKVDRLNQDTSSKLEEISIELQSITHKIAIATGGKNRGLR